MRVANFCSFFWNPESRPAWTRLRTVWCGGGLTARVLGIELQVIARVSTSFPAQMQLEHQRKWGRLGRSQGGAKVGHQHVPASHPHGGDGLPRLGRPRSGFRGDEWASQGSSRLGPVPAPGADCRVPAEQPLQAHVWASECWRNLGRSARCRLRELGSRLARGQTSEHREGRAARRCEQTLADRAVQAGRGRETRWAPVTWAH